MLPTVNKFVLFFEFCFSDYAGVPPVAVPQRVGGVWQSSAALGLGAAGSRAHIAAAVAGLLARWTPGQAFFM